MSSRSTFEKDMTYLYEQFPSHHLFADKTIVITGCAGFLGFYLTNYFISLGQHGMQVKQLVLVDHFLLGKPAWLEELANKHEYVQLHAFDIARDSFSNVPIFQQADYFIHMASIASPTYYRQYPVETMEANVWGLKQILDGYRDKPLSGLLFFSSSEVYGDPLPAFIPTPEHYRGNVSTIGPRACYDESKRMGETLCYVYASQYGMPIRIVRPFNNYGPGMKLDDKRLPADLANAIIHNKDIVIYSDGTPTRTFCYIADAIVGYLRVLVHHEFDYFNIGMDNPELSIKELVDIYVQAGKEIWGYTGQCTFAESEDGDYLTDSPLRRCPDLSKAKQLIGFEPSIRVEEGVRRYLQYLKEESVPT
ncbi:NAD-dependent epimerase/dehydratase family protein [Paenibacillus sinopodophylli]|uniref:NAD-dependent epimerase/dehydratase family protein n=1 Tax=Paenibacillus sinopodophylli TaxID=1837342 RepID=UPI001BB1EDD5|nr:NAD-dependent epimerase/dehydratase family protein [Paenibacillus sinopodophylli]